MQPESNLTKTPNSKKKERKKEEIVLSYKSEQHLERNFLLVFMYPNRKTPINKYASLKPRI